MAVRQTRNQSGGAKLTQNARASFLVIAPAAILAIASSRCSEWLAASYYTHDLTNLKQNWRSQKGRSKAQTKDW